MKRILCDMGNSSDEFTKVRRWGQHPGRMSEVEVGGGGSFLLRLYFSAGFRASWICFIF